MHADERCGSLLLPMVEKPPTPKAAPHAAFGRLVSDKLDRMRLSNPKAAKAVGVTPEMIRRYRDGLVMPRDRALEKLAKLLGVPVGELRYGTGTATKAHPMPLERLTPDERFMLEEFRQLPDYAQKAARARIIELLEEFGPPGAKNPFGKGGTQ